jgi:ribosomal protein L16 Arg81 hydroxylase
MTTFDFDAVLAPFDARTFLRKHFGKSYLHIRGGADKTAPIMTFDKMSELMSMTSHWTPQSMMVVLERKTIPADQYCSPVPGSGVLRPDPDKVQNWIRRGASVVLNDIDELSPEVKAVSRALEEATGGLTQANLYFSMRQRQAFGPHYDTHEVFALHCCGTKVWRLYDGRADGPINHPSYKKSGAEFEKMVGDLAEEVTLEPGDLLYLPRGVYHDALASDNGAVHIAFGVVMPKYIDLLPILWEAAVHSPLMRSDLPVQAGGQDLEKALQDMGSELKSLVGTGAFRKAAEAALAGYSPSRQDYDISALTKSEPVYLVTQGIAVRQANGKTMLHDGRQGVEIPGGIAPLVSWVVGRKELTMSELATAFPAMGDGARRDLLQKLGTLGVVS